MSKQRNPRAPGRKKLLRWVILLAAANVLAASVLVGGIIRYYHRQALRQEAIARQIGVYSGMDVTQQEEQLAIALGQATRGVTMHSEVTVSDGMVPLWLSNSEDNTCAVAVTLELVQTGEVLAQSDPVDPGWHLENLELEKKLKPGSYQCFVRCVFYTREEDLLLGETVRQILLTVK